ncbi:MULTISPECIES: hypothetical protein [unclassified Mycolicibacterium]|uniref:hypothetical protein n=1 Tax=unclassified Mycolicibacterium TaxID=2636767 RepID=UPI002ED9465B
MKWALGGVTLIAVIAITAAVSIALTKGSGGGGNGTPTASASPSATPSGTASNSTGEIASANDTGPVNIITEEPTCSAWSPINDTFVGMQKKGWDKRDPNLPATEWNADQRKMYEDVGAAARSAADQTVSLAKRTPHRVMREIYEQFIAYSRAYADAIPNYSPPDNHLAGVALTSSILVNWICGAISSGSAEARASSVADTAAPADAGKPADVSNPARFMTTADQTCGEWSSRLDRFYADGTVIAWQNLDANLAASQWKPEERSIIDSVGPVMTAFADDVVKIGQASSNLVVQDLAVLSAQYRRGYVAALQTYTPADSYLAQASGKATSMIALACQAAGS